jgi:hypothetical protein
VSALAFFSSGMGPGPHFVASPAISREKVQPDEGEVPDDFRLL